MHQADVYSLIDKRKGQIQDYRFTPEIKAELIQQVAANAITGKPTSSRAVSEQINQRCNLVLPDRTVRLHMKKLGLPKISKTLPTLVEDLKKTPSNDH
jgi:predicted RND superfamily exporter protein